MFIFYKKPPFYKNTFGGSKQLFKFNKIILDKLDKKNENTLFLKNYIIQTPLNRNINIFNFLSISYFMYILFYYNKYKYINI